jgi:hypothetical protein
MAPHKSSIEEEKGSVEHASHVERETSTDDGIDTSGVNEAALVRKIDWHILPLICVLYLLAFLDRCVLLLGRGNDPLTALAE